jgi:5-methylcytosine-specific restriction endonuclease McrA
MGRMEMPIKPENKGRYPANWKSEIRPAILKRAENEHGWPCCEECGVPNHAWGWREDDGTFHDGGTESIARDLAPEGKNAFQIVLTVAHLNHIEEDVRDENLRAWCQRCHLRYDAPRKRADAKAKKATGDLFAMEKI